MVRAQRQGLRIKSLRGVSVSELLAAQAVICVTGGLLGGMLASAAEKRNRLVKRTEQIELATTLLKQHSCSLELFVNDPASPDSLVDMLLWFSEAADDQDIARVIATDYLNEVSPETSDSARLLIKDLESLEGIRPDLVEEFRSAVSSGLTSMFLRWNDTAQLFDRLVAKTMAVSPKREIVVASYVASSERFRKDGYRNNSNFGNFVDAVPC